MTTEPALPRRVPGVSLDQAGTENPEPGLPGEAITDLNPDGNPALAAAVDAILNRRLATAHGIGDYTPRRAALLLEILPDATAALEAVRPHLAGADRDLLTQAENTLHSLSLRLLGVSPRLKEPYTDVPECSPWSMTIGPLAHRAHDLAVSIRRHLGLQHSGASRALGTPPLEAEDVVAAEQERIAQAAQELKITLARPGFGNGYTETQDVVPLCELLAALHQDPGGDGT